MKRRNFGKGFFDDDFFAEFERIEEMMRQMLEEHMQHFDESDAKEIRNSNPKVYGFSLEFGPEGKGKLTEFGAAPGARKKPPQMPKFEPLIETIDTPEEITLIAELPGVSENHLDIQPFENHVGIRVSDPQRLFSKTLSLPAKVDPKSIKKSLKNGILEIILKKK